MKIQATSIKEMGIPVEATFRNTILEVDVETQGDNVRIYIEDLDTEILVLRGDLLQALNIKE